MVDFNKNKWKYSTIGLMGFLAILVIPGAIFPQANAVTDTTQLVQQILNIVKSQVYGNQAIMNAITGLTSGASTNTNNILTAITHVQGNVTDLQDKVDGLKPKAIDVTATQNPPQGSSFTYDILSEKSGTTYSGIITGVVVPGGNAVELWCEIGHRFTFLGGELGGDDDHEFSLPFTCKNLALVSSDNDDVGAAKLSATLQYVENNDVTTVNSTQ